MPVVTLQQNGKRSVSDFQKRTSASNPSSTSACNKKMIVGAVYAQLLVLKPAEEICSRGKTSAVFVDFQEVVDSVGLFCSDLSDFVRVGDRVLVHEIINVDGLNFGKKIRIFIDVKARVVDVSNTRNLYTIGVGRVQYVGDRYAVVQPMQKDHTPSSEKCRFRLDYLLSASALTKDSCPVETTSMKKGQVQLKNFVRVGEVIRYKMQPRWFVCNEDGDDVRATTTYLPYIISGRKESK